MTLNTISNVVTMTTDFGNSQLMMSDVLPFFFIWSPNLEVNIGEHDWKCMRKWHGSDVKSYKPINVWCSPRFCSEWTQIYFLDGKERRACFKNYIQDACMRMVKWTKVVACQFRGPSGHIFLVTYLKTTIIIHIEVTNQVGHDVCLNIFANHMLYIHRSRF